MLMPWMPYEDLMDWLHQATYGALSAIGLSVGLAFVVWVLASLRGR